MAVKIRLRRMGYKKHPFYRVIVQIQDPQEMVDSSRRLEHMILTRSQA